MSPLKRQLALAALLVPVAISTGCGGFAASRSVSPLDFIVPHVMEPRAVPSRPNLPAAEVSNATPPPAPLTSL